MGYLPGLVYSSNSPNKKNNVQDMAPQKVNITQKTYVLDMGLDTGSEKVKNNDQDMGPKSANPDTPLQPQTHTGVRWWW